MTHQPRPVAFSLFYTTAPLVLTPMRTDIDESLKFFRHFPPCPAPRRRSSVSTPPVTLSPRPPKTTFGRVLNDMEGRVGTAMMVVGGWPAPGSVSPSWGMAKSGGCLGPWLGWFSYGAMVPFPLQSSQACAPGHMH